MSPQLLLVNTCIIYSTKETISYKRPLEIFTNSLGRFWRLYEKPPTSLKFAIII
jgi:hypothetical protein